MDLLIKVAVADQPHKRQDSTEVDLFLSPFDVWLPQSCGELLGCSLDFFAALMQVHGGLSNSLVLQLDCAKKIISVIDRKRRVIILKNLFLKIDIIGC